nr:hypothetical protein [Tanacetum cinerariifolium]
MTRSSTKKLVTPFKELERVFRSSRKLKGLDVPTRQILDSKGTTPSMKVVDAKKSIQDMADHSQKWHNGTSTRTRNIETSNGLATIQAQLNNLGREIKKTYVKGGPRIRYQIKASIYVNDSAILQDSLPPKEKDPGSFTLPCQLQLLSQLQQPKIRIDEEYARKLEAKEHEAVRLSRSQQNEEANNSWDNIQAMMDADRLLAERIQVREREEFSEMRMLSQLLMILKSLKVYGIVPDDEDWVLIEATPLSSRSPTIIDYKIHKEGKKTYFKITRADSNSQVYQTFKKMFKNFNREDLEVMWAIVKDRFKKEKPVDDMDNILFRTLKTMFEHHVEDDCFDQFQPPQYSDVHQPSKEISIDELRITMQSYFKRMNQKPQRKQELRGQEKASQEKEKPPQNSNFRQLIGEVCGTKVCEEQKKNMEAAMLELLEDCRQKSFIKEVKKIVEQPTKRRTRSLQNFRAIHKMSSISNTSQISSIIAIAPDLPTKEPEYSLSMRDEHLSTILKTKSDKLIKSSVKNLVLIPSESEVTFDNEKLNAEIADTIVESLSSSHILIEGSDSQMEEIGLFLDTDNLMPPGIENDDHDSGGDIHFLKELLSNDTLRHLENESSNFNHHDDPSFPRPPLEPLDVEIFFDFEPDTGVLTAKVVKGISENYVFIPNILPSQPTLCPNIDNVFRFHPKKGQSVQTWYSFLSSRISS